MKLILTDDDGTVLDTTTLTADEYRAEVKRNPLGTLAALSPGAAVLSSDEAIASLRERLTASFALVDEQQLRLEQTMRD